MPGVSKCLTRAAPPPWESLLRENAKVLLYLGRFHPKKGLPNLLAWVAQAAPPHARLWFVLDMCSTTADSRSPST